MSAPHYLVSLSLPKTGTTFLANLLSGNPHVASSSIKEPSFYFDSERPPGSVLSQCQVKGNLLKGWSWYGALYQPPSAPYRADFSTQYWLHRPEVLEGTSALRTTFIIIERDPTDQIISYVAHLRRGYIGQAPLSKLCDQDPSFLAYLDQMFSYPAALGDVKLGPNQNLSRMDFTQLTRDPVRHIEEHLGLQVEAPTASTDRNSRSHPKFPLINQVLFSRQLRAVGRALPNSMYSTAVRLRKRAAKSNLSPGDSDTAESDRDFLTDRYS